MERRVRDLERQMRELQGARGLEASSFSGGRFLFYDGDGEIRWAMGNGVAPGTLNNPGLSPLYGVVGYGDDEVVAFATREGDRGLTYPHMPTVFQEVTPLTTTGGTFSDFYSAFTDDPPAEVIVVGFAVAADASTVGEVRLHELYTGDSTDAITVPAGSSGQALFAWLHPAKTGWGDQRADRAYLMDVSIQARRVSGAGNIYIWRPNREYFSSTYFWPDADIDGAPQFT